MKLINEDLCLHVKKADDIFIAMGITDEIAQQMGFLHYDKLFLRLVTEEACMNAFEYCQNTKQKGFTVYWNPEQDFLTILLKHKGEKFNINVIEKGVSYGLRGRGLQLIVNLMDHVHVHQNGEFVELYMRKYVTQYMQRERTGF